MVKSEEDIQIETEGKDDAGCIEFYSFHPGPEVAEAADEAWVAGSIVSPVMRHVPDPVLRALGLGS